MEIKYNNENLKLLILIVLAPLFFISVLAASKMVLVVEKIMPSAYEISDLKSLKILDPALPAEIIVLLRVKIADSPETQEKGLSGIKSLPKKEGMLFVFDSPDRYSFWMKGMNFSLDFIWISGNEIVEITKNVKPEDYQPILGSIDQGKPPKMLVPGEKIDKVLEVNAGVADKFNIKAGDIIEF